jgi:hypothetical protein
VIVTFGGATGSGTGSCTGAGAGLTGSATGASQCRAGGGDAAGATAAVARAGSAASSRATAKMALQTAQRARIPPSGTFRGSTRYMVAQLGHVTFIADSSSLFPPSGAIATLAAVHHEN